VELYNPSLFKQHQCLDFVPLPSTTREDIFVVLSHQFVVICDGTPRKLGVGLFPLLPPYPPSPVSAITSGSILHWSLKDFYFQKEDEDDGFERVKCGESGFCSGLAPRNNVITRVVNNSV